MAKLREFLDSRNDSTIENFIYAYIDRDKDSKDVDKRSAWEKRHAQTENFRQRIISKTITPKAELLENGPRIRRVTYDMLPELLRIAELNGRQLYELMGVTVPWPDEQFRILAERCELLPEKMIDQIFTSAVQMTPNWWMSDEIKEAHPSDRARLLFQHRFPRTMRKTIDCPPLEKVWNDQHSAYTIPFLDFPEVAQTLNVNLHWLLCFDDRTCFFGSRPEIDLILNVFSFMPDRLRQTFFEAVQMRCEGRGV